MWQTWRLVSLVAVVAGDVAGDVDVVGDIVVAVITVVTVIFIGDVSFGLSFSELELSPVELSRDGVSTEVIPVFINASIGDLADGSTIFSY